MSFFSSHSSKIESDAPWAITIGVILALLVQVLFYIFASHLLIVPRQTVPPITVIPKPFNIKKVEISAEVLKELDDYSLAPKTPESVAQIVIPSDNPVDDLLPEEIRAAPVSSTLPNPFDTPAARAEALADLSKAATTSGDEARRAIEEDLRRQGEQLLAEETRPEGNPQPLLSLSDLANRKITDGMLRSLPGEGQLSIPDGYISLDDALASTAPLRSGSAPILMPTDLLFEFNEFVLRPRAEASLAKLGDLIRRNPHARFIIEGHTDSEGSHEYNQLLSERRAETVARWLIENMRIDPSHISTRGYGETRLIVPGDRSREEQSINRRVEIIIRSK